MLVVFSSAAVVVTVAFALAIVVGEWWILPLALVVHLVATGIVLAFMGGKMLEDRDKPDPVTEARLEEEAVEESRNGSRRPQGEEERGVFGHYARAAPQVLSARLACVFSGSSIDSRL